MDKIDQIIKTGQNILVVNNDIKQSYKFVSELLSRLDATKYDSSISIIINDIDLQFFNKLKFTIMPYIRPIYIENNILKKKIVIIDFDQHRYTDPDVLEYIGKFGSNVFLIVLCFPSSSKKTEEKLHELMGNDTLYINDNIVYCPTPKYIPDPRFVEKSSRW